MDYLVYEVFCVSLNVTTEQKSRVYLQNLKKGEPDHITWCNTWFLWRPMGNFVPSFLSSALQICLSLKFLFYLHLFFVIASAFLRWLIIPNYLLVIKNESLHHLYYCFDQSPLLFLPILEFVRAVSSSNLSFLW